MAERLHLRLTVALLTDFGADSAFAGAMKAVILGANPEARIFDISHGIAPQAVEEGAFILGSVIPVLPDGCICVAVVDPGVGSDRGAVALQTPRGVFIGPDNGLLSAALDEHTREESVRNGVASAVRLPSNAQAVRLTNPRYHRRPTSATFHGRDIFASVAGYISLGVEFASLGEESGTILAFPPWRAALAGADTLAGRVISIDHFGNIVTDIRDQDVAGRSVRIEIGAATIARLDRTYADSAGLLAYIGSAGYLEIAMRDGNASGQLGIPRGATVLVRSAPPGEGGA
jgi:S-adenosyl-L-methionine hydrolase (adenosine-forming)